MSNWTFKIDSATQSLGVFEVKVARIASNILIPPLTVGQVVEVFKWGETYREFTIIGRFIGTESEIKTFITNLQTAESDPSLVNQDRPQCYLTPRWDTTAIKCFVVNFDYTDNKGAPGYVDYTLTLVEGEPFVV
jgi:hypothetical protein